MKKKRIRGLTRKTIRRCWTIGSAGGLAGWLDRFMDELEKAINVEIPPK